VEKKRPEIKKPFTLMYSLLGNVSPGSAPQSEQELTDRTGTSLLSARTEPSRRPRRITSLVSRSLAALPISSRSTTSSLCLPRSAAVLRRSPRVGKSRR
jgi:hypothetical protein